MLSTFRRIGAFVARAAQVKPRVGSVDRLGMKRYLVSCLVLVLLAAPTLGCYVLDELDASKKEVDRYSKHKQKEEAPKAEQKAEAGKVDLPAYQDQLKQWWGKSHSLDPQDIDSSIVRCLLGGKTQFMGRDDCLARGGKASNASG